MSYDAVVLAGGSAARLGGLHKPGLRLGGLTLLERVLAAVATAGRRVVVGPEQPVPPGVLLVREDPVGGGPVAALSAGLATLPAGSSGPEVAVLAGDLPFVSGSVISALRDSIGDGDGALLLDETGRAQLLLGVWRRAALDRVLLGFGEPSGVPMRKLVGGLTFHSLEWTVQPGTAPPWWDCDTAEDLRRAAEWLSPEEGL